ncbi:hypothetical protein BJV82DRAFT_594125 [Fennellomyces sp. T-0311]|nr:hypothetical protein BJV82DRAFT_594125 [Fennellomyces sp. T-0311]
MHLAKNQGILEFLSILRPAYNDEDWSPIFESLRMPNLRILICGNIKLFTTSSLITMLNSCSVLQKLDLDCLNSTFDSALIRLLCTMNSVRSLQIKNVEFRDALALMTFLERFPELETLGLEYISLPPEFPEYFQCLPQLKALTISEITWIRNESQQVNIDEAFARFLSQLAYGAKLEYLRLISIPELK